MSSQVSQTSHGLPDKVKSEKKILNRLMFGGLFAGDCNFSEWCLDNEQLQIISSLMTKCWDPNVETEANPISSNIPAGLTYFGQMITHDIVPNTNTNDERHVTAYLNLDSLYPCMCCDHNAFNLLNLNGTFKLDEIIIDHIQKGWDFKRISEGSNKGRACIKEPRNDENVILSQLVVIWMALHNEVIIFLENQNCVESAQERYSLAREFVIICFQKVTIDDYLSKILQKTIFDHYFGEKSCKGGQFLIECVSEGSIVPLKIPMEFSHAAFRFGHSMVLQSYRLNTDHEKTTQVQNLFKKNIPIDEKTYVDFRLFFVQHNKKVKGVFNFASGIGLSLAGGLTIVKGDNEMKLERLVRPQTNYDLDVINDIKLNGDDKYPEKLDSDNEGIHINVKNLIGLDIKSSSKLPTGGEILNALSKSNLMLMKVLDIKDLDSYKKLFNFSKKGGSLLKGNLISVDKKEKPVSLNINNAPLWLFVLREAEVYPVPGGIFQADKLGPITSLIIAEVMSVSMKGAIISLFREWGTWNSYLKNNHPLCELYTRILNKNEDKKLTVIDIILLTEELKNARH